MPARVWLDLTTEDFRSRDMSRAIAVLPVAAVEQHGPHLPVGVDAYIAEGYLARAMQLVPEDLDVLFLPVQAVGKSNEHLAFPGTLTFSAETVIRAWYDIGESVFRAGCKKLVFINSHGGNIAVLDIVTRELRVRLGMLTVAASWHGFGYPDGMFEAEELRHGIHAGDVETSLMLALRPETVRGERAENFTPRTVAMARELTHLQAMLPTRLGWMAQDIHPKGAMGDATQASREKGEASADFGAQRFIELLRDIDRFSLSPPP
jgi:creatinine amidohydrolase